MTKTDSWLTVDRAGLGKIMERRGKAFAALELVSNAMDEDGATCADVTLTVTDRGRALLVVEDDAPAGFADLTHSHTLFAESGKKGAAEKRGRFNLGEKLVLAIAVNAVVKSTTGAVLFSADGTRVTDPSQRTKSGSVITATVKMTKAEVADAVAALRAVLVPPGFRLVVNGETMPNRTPERTVKATLPSELADDEGNLRPTERLTTVDLHRPLDGETATIYELGIPVVTHDGAWHVDVGQKVPLNMDRDNVTPGYLRKLRTIMVDAAADLLTEAEAAKPWVAEGMERAKPEAVEKVLTQRFGAKRVAYDPTNPEANKKAMDEGYAVVHGGSLSRAGWEAARSTGTTRPAGQVITTTVKMSPDGVDRRVDPDKWTLAQVNVVEYARRVTLHLTGRTADVDIVSDVTGEFAAHWMRPGHLTLNVGRLGHRWFDRAYEGDADAVEAVDALLIHECAHERVSDHYSRAFYDECCRLGAKLRSGPTLADVGWGIGVKGGAA